MHRLRLLWRRRATRANRPHRLIGHNGLGEGLHPGKLQHRRQLGGNHQLGLPCLTLLQRLTNA